MDNRTLKRTATSALVLAIASGCAFFEKEEEDLDFAAHEGRLTEMYNESNRLTAELDAAETRIVQGCLEEQGFTLHDPAMFAGDDAMPERDSFLMTAPHADFLPTVEEAERRGFWQWTKLEGAEAYEDGALYAEWQLQLQTSLEAVMPPEFAEGAIQALAGEEDELDEFYLRAPADQYAWYVAYAGEDWAAYNYPELGGSETDPDGAVVLGGPPPEGCLRDMIDAVYGGIEEVENEEEGFSDWIARPESPVGDREAMTGRYTERLAEAESESDFLDCLSGRGSVGWEFRGSEVPVHEYLVEAGEGEEPVRTPGGDGGAWPDPPGDVPAADDLEGWLAFERDLAVEFAECGDESGFRAAAEHAWQQAQLRYYLDIEDDTYAWQDEMRGYLEKAQEVIGG